MDVAGLQHPANEPGLSFESFGGRRGGIGQRLAEQGDLALTQVAIGAAVEFVGDPQELGPLGLKGRRGPGGDRPHDDQRQRTNASG